VDRDSLRARLQARERELAGAAPRETVAKFLRTYCADADGLEEVRAEVGRTVATNPASVRRFLDALAALLGEPPAEGTLARLVAEDANWGLEDASDAGARAWLEALGGLVRGVLDQAGTPGAQGPPGRP
jgi:hypothetical protein